MEHFELNNGVWMPKIGLGVYNIKSENEDALLWALRNGYRHLDTAAAYRNEELIARAIKKSGVNRGDIFITTKVWSSDLGRKTKQAFETSLRKLQTDYIDLYLIHWPAKNYLDSWTTMESLYKEGKIRAIGLKAVFVYLESHYLFFSTMLSGQRTAAFRDCMMGITKSLIRKQINSKGSNLDLDAEVTLQFAASAFVGVVEWWIANQMPHKPAYMADQAIRLFERHDICG